MLSIQNFLFLLWRKKVYFLPILHLGKLFWTMNYGEKSSLPLPSLAPEIPQMIFSELLIQDALTT